MSVSTTVSARLESGRVYPELPIGIFPWTANGEITGNAGGGTANVDVEMHPGAAPAFTLYVAIATTAVKIQTAANVGKIEVRITQPAQWEFDYSSVVPIDVLDPQVTTTATVELAAQNRQLAYLGRTMPGLPGNFNVTTINVDTMVMKVRIVGFYSDRPFIPHNDWRL